MQSIQLSRRVASLALFLAAASNSQVIIRERVAIDPKPTVQAQVSSTVNATLRYELQYDGPVRSPELNFMRLQELVCGVFQSGPINSSLTVPAQSGLWNFSFRIHTPIVSNQYARFTAWLGEDVILKDSLLINCGSTCQINHQFGFRISNTFNFTANGQIFYTEQSFLNAQASGQQHCTTEMWHPGLPVNLRIVSGGHLGQFADLNGSPLGHEVTVPGFNVDNVTFLADGVEPDSISDFVTIEASSFGITRTATIEVLRISDSPIWLVMDAQGDVSYGAQMSVIAQALDMFQSEVSAGTGVTYSFEIVEGSEWGSLRRGSVEGNIITGVRPTNDFFSRGRGSVDFLARKSEPTEPQRVTIRVAASNPEIRPGTYSFNVLPSPLAITVSPPSISYGQQAVISVQKKNPEGTTSPWPEDAGFSYEIIKGHNAGYILHLDTARRDDFFSGQSDTIRFVALEESPQPDTVEVQFYIYVFNEGGGIATATFDPIQPNPTLRRTGLASLIVVKETSNRPPVITSVNRNPSSTYYQLGSQVEIVAEAFDPDGDSVSIQYLPSQVITLTTPGRQVFTVTATDPEGASDERTDTVFVVFAVIEPDLVSVIDGEAAGFHMSLQPEEFVASTFYWNWEARDAPAGNDPHVDFVPSNAGQNVTVPNARWYAFPDDPCGANHKSIYRILGAAMFGQDSIRATDSELEVRVPKIGGFTWVEIAGYPQVDTVKLPTGQPVRYRFVGPGSLTRVIKDTVFLPITSQFYRKSRLHEDVHIAHFQSGPVENLWNVESLFQRLRGMNAMTPRELAEKYMREYDRFDLEQAQELDKLRKTLEDEAYLVSDSIPPLYFHSGCR